MIHKKLPGTISEYDLGEIYSYLEYFNKMYVGFESEIDSILAGIVEIYKIEYCHDCNIVSWNGGEPKVDIREWSPDHSRMSRGICIKEDQAEKLAMCLGQRMMNRQKAQKKKDSFER